jgi:5-hydroxyisourate hydrolase-like protein (transthyretin family)
MKYLLLLALAFLTGCSTLELKLSDNATGQPISGANITVQYLSVNQENKDLDIIGTCTTDDQGRATLQALFDKHKDFQLLITRHNDLYKTLLIRHNITNFSQTVVGVQSLKATQKVADPTTPTIDIKYRWE